MELTTKQKKIGKYTLIGLGCILTYKLFFGKPKDKAVYDENGQIIDPTGNTTGSGNVETFSATKKATELLVAMDRFGTDENAIFKTLNGVTQTQFGQIRQVFGLKQYNGVSQGVPGDIFGLVPSIPLERWLKEELSTSSYNTLKIRFPNYL